jgi:hypothetical protein
VFQMFLGSWVQCVFKHCPRYNKRTMKNRKIVENDILANQKYISMVRFAFQIRADCLLRIVFKINIKHLEVPSFFDTYIYNFFFFLWFWSLNSRASCLLGRYFTTRITPSALAYVHKSKIGKYFSLFTFLCYYHNYFNYFLYFIYCLTICSFNLHCMKLLLK